MFTSRHLGLNQPINNQVPNQNMGAVPQMRLTMHNLILKLQCNSILSLILNLEDKMTMKEQEDQQDLAADQTKSWKQLH